MREQLLVIQSIAEAIRTAGQVQASTLYAATETDAAGFSRIVDILVRARVIAKEGDMLVWQPQP